MRQDTTCKQSQSVADLLNATRNGHRTIEDLEEVSGMETEAVRRWVRAFAEVGILKPGEPRKSRTKPATTWTMAR